MPCISIHALREEGDSMAGCFSPSNLQISIHALREEGDMVRWEVALPQFIFQSTPSARRATCKAECGAWQTPYFNPRPPRGGRHGPLGSSPAAVYISIHALREEGDPSLRKRQQQKHISIHALREEGDDIDAVQSPHKKDFNPRPPRGGRPPYVSACSGGKNISIHALREEGDG